MSKRDKIKQLIKIFINEGFFSDIAIDGLTSNIIQTIKYSKRSMNENNYYWAVIVKILGDHFGYTPEEMHEALKFKFLRIENPGKPTTVRSTASEDFTTIDAETYYENIRRWAAIEYGVVIPLPNEGI